MFTLTSYPPHREVIPFVFQHWLKQPVRLTIVLVGFLGAPIADLLMPVYSGHLVDALTSGPHDMAARHAALVAFGGIISLGLISLILRFVGLKASVPLTLKTIADATCEAFMRVQRFSTELAHQFLCRLNRSPDHAWHVCARPAQCHRSDGIMAVARRARRLDDPANPALARARQRDRGRRGYLCRDHYWHDDRLYCANGTNIKCLGYQGRRHTGGRAHLQTPW